MNSTLFNSPFEMGLRALLLLSSAPKQEFTVDRIVALDFITCYSADFGLPYQNLHGENNYKYGEIANRRMLVQEAIKDLVLRGLVDVKIDRGYNFTISAEGKKYAGKLKSSFAADYKEIAKKAISKNKDNTDEGILATIQSLSVRSVRR